MHSSGFGLFLSEFEKSTLIGHKIRENLGIRIQTWINHISKFIPQKSSELRQLPERSEKFQLKHQFLNKLHLKNDDPAFIFS